MAIESRIVSEWSFKIKRDGMCGRTFQVSYFMVAHAKQITTSEFRLTNVPLERSKLKVWVSDTDLHWKVQNIFCIFEMWVDLNYYYEGLLNYLLCALSPQCTTWIRFCSLLSLVLVPILKKVRHTSS